ncbi:MAG TPA: tyrosine--tRNA ligase [Candidatus Baltobacteraceae bacterium]|nr:tyrosine--tRNA ligase [Candidatus Baltobacteraceae bacterium]
MFRTASPTTEELLDGFDHVETRPEFEARIREGKPLTVKLGLDPTSADLHLGHAVVLHKMQQFVEAGHKVVLLIGDFTARIGDPTGRNELRPPLTTEEIEANMQTYAAQAGRVLDMDRVTLEYNSTWLSPLTMADLLRLLSQVTVAQMLEREDFRTRYSAGTPISLHEFLYPVAQAYDSIALHADVELGGNDQLFNLLMGRHYQRHAGQREQICMTLPLLEGLDGVEKMSKSKGNYVGITESPEQQFGKLMRITDEMIPRYARLAASCSQAEAGKLIEGLNDGHLHPMDEKKRIAEDIVARYHGRDAAKAARDYFERTVQRRELPTDNIPEIRLGQARKVSQLIVAAGFAESKRAAERLISGNGVKVDGILVGDPNAQWTAAEPAVLSVGSRKFVRVLPNEG